MLRRFNLKPMAIPAKEDPLDHKIGDLVDGLKHMDMNDVKKIHKNFLKIKNASLVYHDVFEYYDRSIIFVKNIVVDGKNLKINMFFYKSSGTSRSTGLKNVWLPTIGINGTDKTIAKLEDDYITKYTTNIHKMIKLWEVQPELSPYVSGEIDNLLKYKRFVTEENAIVSFLLAFFDINNKQQFTISNMTDYLIRTKSLVLNYADFINGPPITLMLTSRQKGGRRK